MSKEYISISEQARALRDIDKQLTELIARRAVLLAGAKPVNPSQARRKQWQELEKDLWQLWEQEAQACRSDLRAWRKMFSLLQELTAQDEPEEASRSYVLAPRREPMRIEMQGPGCTLSSRLWAALAVQASQPLSVSGVLRNDRLVELVKALNQAGASLYWDDAGLHSRGASQATFDEGVIFAGEDSQNLLLLVALCLGRPGAARFTGGAGLKLQDFSGLRGFLPQLGARLAFMHPGSSSVPFRLECSGMLPDSVRLPKDMDPRLAGQLALALCLAAPSYQRDFTLLWDTTHEQHVAPLVAVAVEMLKACGSDTALEGGSYSVRAGDFKPPRQVALPLDAFISTFFLALPLFSGGECVLRGHWPKDVLLWRGAASLLESAGLELQAGAREIRSAPKERFVFQELASEDSPELFPLALGLAAWQAQQPDQSSASLRLGLPRACDPRPAAELAGLVGVEFVEQGESYALRKCPASYGGADAFVAPDGRWCLAAALASFCRPGLQLANPGEVAELMSNFWKFFNALPEPGGIVSGRKASRPADTEEGNDGKKRRRRIVP